MPFIRKFDWTTLWIVELSAVISAVGPNAGYRIHRNRRVCVQFILYDNKWTYRNRLVSRSRIVLRTKSTDLQVLHMKRSAAPFCLWTMLYWIVTVHPILRRTDCHYKKTAHIGLFKTESQFLSFIVFCSLLLFFFDLLWPTTSDKSPTVRFWPYQALYIYT